MNSAYDLVDQVVAAVGMSTAHRPLRLRIAYPKDVADAGFMPQSISGTETICGGIEYRILCVSADAHVQLKSLMGLATELQLVTDRGDLHNICGVITEAHAGQGDGGLATYQIVVRDALALMDQIVNSRVFFDKNEIEIIEILLGQWRERDHTLAAAFEYEFGFELKQRNFPKRKFTMQCNETSAGFIRRLLKRRGIAWFFRPGRASTSTVPDDGLERSPVHTLFMFDEQSRLKQNAAGSVRFHRFGATEERDTVTAWSAVRSLKLGSVTGFSWDYADPQATGFMTTNARSRVNQGVRGNRLAAGMEQYLVESPHIGDDNSDHAQLGQARMAYHDYASKHFEGKSNVRDLRIGEWISLENHAEIDTHPEQERQFIITSLRVSARNNLPKDLDARIDQLFSHNHWTSVEVRYQNTFTCVRRGTRIVPAYDPKVDVPEAGVQSAIVVGPPDEEIHCDELGRVKVRFKGMREGDHAHAQGAGASDTDADSGWIRVGGNWAGNGPGCFGQFGAGFLPRVGTEVIVAFLNGDPDKPVIINQIYNRRGTTAALSRRGGLPGNRYLSGMRSRERRSTRGNQLRFDDTAGQISAQLASDHGASELNLGWCSEPRADGAGEARGEGAELRSDEYIALRAAKGLLLSAWKRMEGADGASGKLLAREEYAALMRECSDLFGALGKYAEEHQAMALDVKAQDELQSAFKNWENGSNTDPTGIDGGAPVIGITSPAGIGFATSKAIVSYAASNIDTVAQQHLQLTAGQRFNLNAGKGISLFSHHDGITAIAHHGKLLMESQHDDTEIHSAKNIKLSAAEGKLIGSAKVIELIADDGSFIRIGDGGITLGSDGTIKFNAADFIYDAPAKLARTFKTFDSAATDLKFVARYYADTDDPLPAPEMNFKIHSEDGSETAGSSDGEGKSALLESDAMHIASIDIEDKDSEL